jgi:hypothetical protein
VQTSHSGRLPPSLAALKKLFNYRTSLIGSLPAQLFPNQIKLVEVRLQFVLIDGSIPVELGSSSNLRILDFFATRLTGSLPQRLVISTRRVVPF